jgi:4-methylaminobutanoate oxidase (formaldehyde-forming)
MTSREITVGDVPCRALRVTYVGELGWELYAPSEFGAALWDTLIEAGTPHGVVPAGYRSIDSLRLEKSYRAWGSDVTPDDSPLEAGLAFAVASGKDFLGKEAFERVRAEGRDAGWLPGLADPRSSTLGNEPVRAGGEIVARVTSGGIGYTVGASIAYAYLPPELAVTGTASRSRSSASGSAPRSRTSRSTTRRASASGPDGRRDVVADEHRAVPVRLEPCVPRRHPLRSKWSSSGSFRFPKS